MIAEVDYGLIGFCWTDEEAEEYADLFTRYIMSRYGLANFGAEE